MSGNVIFKFDIFGEQVIEGNPVGNKGEIQPLYQNIEDIRSNLTVEIQNLNNQLKEKVKVIDIQLDERTREREADFKVINQIQTLAKILRI